MKEAPSQMKLPSNGNVSPRSLKSPNPRKDILKSIEAKTNAIISASKEHVGESIREKHFAALSVRSALQETPLFYRKKSNNT